MASEFLENPMSSGDIMFGTNQTGAGRSWAELKNAVKETNKLVSSLASRVPSSFKFRTEQTPHGPVTRLYFLGIPPKQRESTLLYVNVPTSPLSITPALQWCPLLESFSSSQSSSQMSREEQLLRERKRLGVFGITSFEVTSSGHIVFPACNSLFTCHDNSLTTDATLFPNNVETKTTGARMDPQICPNNPNLVAFINTNDLWVVNTSTGQEIRLTYSNKGTGSLQQEPISSGVPSFVVQEEFDRYTGYWWEPVTDFTHNASPTSLTGPHTYRIMYEEVDESEVEIIQIYSPSEDKGVDEYRYPKPGKANARSSLKIVEFNVNEDGQISDQVEIKGLYEPLDRFFPDIEYFVRGGWTPDGQFIHCQLLNRRQTQLLLVLIPVECFVSMATLEAAVNEGAAGVDPLKMFPPIQVICKDVTDVWINIHDVLHFLPRKSAIPDEVQFIWMSEESGFRHLYHVTTKLADCSDSVNLVDANTGVLHCENVKRVPLTSGDWEVLSKEIWVDTQRQLVYFVGFKDTALETHLYVVSYSNPREVVRLTQPGYSHNIYMNKECSVFVSVYSSVETTPMSTLYQILHGSSSIKTQPLGVLMPSSPCAEYVPPELFSYTSKCGFLMHGMFYRPHNQQPGVKYPTVLFVYGGPHVQLVSNSFKGLKFLRLHTLASQGYAVVVVDSRGSCYRGQKFESHIKHRMGTTEIEDQVEGLQWLMSHVDFIDENRVGIHGWSYGGYLSLMGLAQRPDIFKVAIAGAPVVSWGLYDSVYTERYMNLPEDNDSGYQLGSVLNYVDNFPDQENRLLIVHGLIDENVHFQHTITLVSGLIKACKPYQLQIYPNERHGIRNHEASEHYKTLVLNFLQKNL